jgi:cytochrome c oxidase assembly factor CtaG
VDRDLDAVSVLRLTALAWLALPLAAFGFHDVAAAPGGQWTFEPWLVGLLGGSAAMYALGLRRLWHRAGRGRGIRPADAARFALGWLVLALAFLSPLDQLAARSFTLHMVQHELLMVVAAPLLVLGRPVEAFAWALAPRARSILAALPRNAVLRGLWAAITEPVGAWCFHAAALWAWHVPALFALALADPRIHVLQHSCFLGSALAFWWAAFGGTARRSDAMSLAMIFTTLLHTGALGALLAVAGTPWYAAGSQPLFGLNALEDQQMGGLVMWVPGSLAYVGAALWIVSGWLSRRSARPAGRAS